MRELSKQASDTEIEEVVDTRLGALAFAIEECGDR